MTGPDRAAPAAHTHVQTTQDCSESGGAAACAAGAARSDMTNHDVSAASAAGAILNGARHLPRTRHPQNAAAQVARQALERARDNCIEIVDDAAHFGERAQTDAAREEAHGGFASMPAAAGGHAPLVSRAMGMLSDRQAREDRGGERDADFAPRLGKLSLHPQACVAGQWRNFCDPLDDGENPQTDARQRVGDLAAEIAGSNDLRGGSSSRWLRNHSGASWAGVSFSFRPGRTVLLKRCSPYRRLPAGIMCARGKWLAGGQPAERKARKTAPYNPSIFRRAASANVALRTRARQHRGNRGLRRGTSRGSFR